MMDCVITLHDNANSLLKREIFIQQLISSVVARLFLEIYTGPIVFHYILPFPLHKNKYHSITLIR